LFVKEVDSDITCVSFVITN